MGFWADTFGGGNSFTESVANTFTPNDGATYVGGTLTYDSGDNEGNVVPVNSSGGFGTSSDNDGKGYTGSANSTSTNSENITSSGVNNDYQASTSGSTSGSSDIKGSAPSGITKLLGFATPLGVIGKLSSWANNLDPEKDIANGEVVDGRQVYDNGTMKYSYNFLGLPYQVEVGEDGKLKDFLRKDATGKYPGDEGYNQSTSGYEKMAQTSRDNGNDDEAAAILQEASDNANTSAASSGTTSSGSQTIIDMATQAGMATSNEQIQAIIDDPAGWLKANGATLVDKIPTLDADTLGTLLDPTSPNYLLGDNPEVTVETTGEVATVDSVENPGATTYDASTTEDLLGTDATTVDAATGEIRDENLVDAAQIDMTGAATGVNADGTASVTGEALNDFASQNISMIIDTSTVAGKLLAQKLGDGNYTDSKATILGQMEIISAEFKNSNGEPVIPPWAQALSRDVAKTMAFSGISGTAMTAAMSNAIMEATLGIAEKEATFFQTITTKNLDNRQQAIINKASVLAKFEVANLDARQAAAVQNAKSFLEMDLTNLTNEQQAEVVNTQAMVDAIFNDQAAINASRLFGAEQTNDMQKYYDNMNAQISLQNSEQLNQMKRFNTGEVNDGREFNAKLEQSRQEFYANMQYNLDLANAKWRQTVATTNTEMEFEAATTDVKNTLDLSTEAMTRMWDRVDNLLDYVFKGWNAESDREAAILGAEIRAQSGSTDGGGNGIVDGLFKLGAAWITSSSDERLKENIEYYDTIKGVKYYTWEWNSEGKRVGANKYPSFGVIAQEVQKKYPKAVTVGEDGYLMVNYGEIQ
jgi:hypothetical protein